MTRCVLEGLEPRNLVSDLLGLSSSSLLNVDVIVPANQFETSPSEVRKLARGDAEWQGSALEETTVHVEVPPRPWSFESVGHPPEVQAPVRVSRPSLPLQPKGVKGAIFATESRLPPPDGRGPITWKKTQIDAKFRSEGVAVADVNRDGRTDVIVGDLWYEAPNWNTHRIRAVGNYGDGATTYSNAFAVFPGDFNDDNWSDVIVIGFPGEPAIWYENPQGNTRWKPHLLWPSACNESPQFVDLFGDGEKELVMAINPEGQMVWFEPGPDPTQLWTPHPISKESVPGDKVPGTEVFSHGLGAGDINSDGRVDVLVTEGWWEQPPIVDGVTPWPFHPVDIAPPSADMVTYDVNEDGLADVISSSPHDYGLWWHEQIPTAGDPTFETQELLRPIFSQSHALNAADLNNDGLVDLVSGKRWWAHGVDGDPGSSEPAVLYWFEARPGSAGGVVFQPREIDRTSGIGTQFTVADTNGDGLLDIIVSNKKGVHIFEQEGV